MPETIENEFGWWRILDANFNRCSEGLRVIEDWCRFVVNQPSLSKFAKDMRHHLHELSFTWPLVARLSARDVPADVGRTIKTLAEQQRPDDLSFLQANFYRVQQSLRVLEEVAKRLQFDTAPDLERLRYRAYELQQKVVLTTQAATASDRSSNDTATDSGRDSFVEKSLSDRLQLLEHADLYVLTDACGSMAAYQRHVQALIEYGINVIQLRDKSLSDRDLWEYSFWTASFLANTRVLFIVNDRPDIAATVAADGVHVGQSELPVEITRRIVGPQRLIGVSTHNREQVIAAQQTSANYLGLGPVFPSKTKGFAEFAGLETLRRCVSALERPTFAIGGIDGSNVGQVYATGMTRIAVQAALTPVRLSPEVVAGLRNKS
jgi:thiamine-phosphate pyrophosphorylase